jgi:hypothetical protein
MAWERQHEKKRTYPEAVEQAHAEFVVLQTGGRR